MVLAQHSNTLIHLIRILFTVIDRVVYWALMQVYDLIDQISRVNLFGEGTLSEFSNRIYMIIGVLMLFKLAFSIINYIVDPDKLADNKKGFAGIVKNIAIMLVLIVTVPLIFKYAMALQYVIVSDNTIGRLITGVEGATTTHVGDNMSVAILSGFIHPDSGVKEGCENWSQECEDALKKYNLDQTYHNAYFSERGYNYLLELAQSTEEMGDGNFVITYNVILSTLVGAFTTWILLMFCIDLAVRIVKLGFLQLIAPIPIVTYMDDGGQGVFKKWVKTCTSTYADLFVRLAAINFAIYVISVFLISGEGNNTLTGNFKICKWSFDGSTLTADCNEQANFFIKLFLILGTLMFAKQLPKLIEDITGLKLDGKFTLNPIKKMQEVPLVGGVGAKALGLAGRTARNLGGIAAGTVGMAAGWAAGKAGGAIKNSDFGKAVSSAAGKAGTAISNLGPVKKFGDISDFVANSRWGRMAGASFNKIGADVRANAMPGFVSKMGDRKIKQLEERIANRKAVEDAVKSAYDGGKLNGNSKVRDLKLREQQLATMKQNVPSRIHVDEYGNNVEMTDAEYEYELNEYNRKMFDMENNIAKDKKNLMRTLENDLANGSLLDENGQKITNDDVARALQKEEAYDSANGLEHYATSEERHNASDGGVVQGKTVRGWKQDLADANDKRIAQQKAEQAANKK